MPIQNHGIQGRGAWLRPDPDARLLLSFAGWCSFPTRVMGPWLAAAARHPMPRSPVAASLESLRDLETSWQWWLRRAVGGVALSLVVQCKLRLEHRPSAVGSAPFSELETSGDSAGLMSVGRAEFDLEAIAGRFPDRRLA